MNNTKLLSLLLPYMLANGVAEPDPKHVSNSSDQSIKELVEEYKLIQQKRSNLSRSKRDSIVYQIKMLIKIGKISEDLTPTES